MRTETHDESSTEVSSWENRFILYSETYHHHDPETYVLIRTVLQKARKTNRDHYNK